MKCYSGFPENEPKHIHHFGADPQETLDANFGHKTSLTSACSSAEIFSPFVWPCDRPYVTRAMFLPRTRTTAEITGTHTSPLEGPQGTRRLRFALPLRSGRGSSLEAESAPPSMLGSGGNSKQSLSYGRFPIEACSIATNRGVDYGLLTEESKASNDVVSRVVAVYGVRSTLTRETLLMDSYVAYKSREEQQLPIESASKTFFGDWS